MHHLYQDRVSLELARRVAEGLDAHPEWIELARGNLDRWMQRNANAPGLVRCYVEWRALLDRGIPVVRATLLDVSDEGQRLRQNSPFSGVLSPSEVWEIKRRLRNDQTAA
jgi:hypothetical protein